MTRSPNAAAIRQHADQYRAEAERAQADFEASRRIIERELARCCVLQARRDSWRRRIADAEALARQIEASERRRVA